MITHLLPVAGFTLLMFFSDGALISADEEIDCSKCIQTQEPTDECSRANIPTPITTKHYYLSCLKASWYQAQQFCALHGMRLATIQNEEQELEMEELMTKYNLIHMWFGVTDLAEKDKYYNVHNGVYVNYTKWLPGQPDKWRPDERCVHVWKPDNVFGWNDGRCEDVDWFACDLLDAYCP